MLAGNMVQPQVWFARVLQFHLNFSFCALRADLSFYALRADLSFYALWADLPPAAPL